MMKAILSSATILVVVLAVAGVAQAQSTFATPSYAVTGYGGGYAGEYGYGYHASTFEEGWLRGLGFLAASQGQANYYNSLAAINAQEAYSRYVQNRQKAIEEYFYAKQTNRAARQAQRSQPLSREQYVALAKKDAPGRLTEQQYNRTLGRLTWPAALAGGEFAAEREALDVAFGSRSLGDVDASSAFYDDVRDLTASMEAKLKLNIDDLDAAQYVIAKKFLMSLAYESQQPLFSHSLAWAR
jgi:hypothetical protein